MRFFVENYRDAWQYFWHQPLMYIPEEHSFYMDRVVNKKEIELIVNKVSLGVSENLIVNVSGFCGLSKSMDSNYHVPEYRKGFLRVEHNLDHGFAYGINDEENNEYPVHVNIKEGWVCLGHPEIQGTAVEFLNNCVAVINKDKKLVSLWFRPEKLPDF